MINDNIHEKKVQLLLTRHGKTIFNEKDRVQGWCDTPLTVDGKTQVSYLGRGLIGYPLDAIYTSTSGRAIETGSIIAEYSCKQGLTQRWYQSLRELYFGKYEGDNNLKLQNDMAKVLNTTIERGIFTKEYTIKEIVDSVVKVDKENDFESWAEFSGRLLKGLDQIVKDSVENNYQKVLIVTHGLSINAILYLISEETRYIEIKNVSVSEIEYQNGRYSVKSINDMSYVEKGRKRNQVNV